MMHPSHQLALIAAAIYATSFFLPVIRILDETSLGWSAFVGSIFMPVFWPAWLANPVFLFAVADIFRGRFGRARLLAVLAFLLGLSEGWMFWQDILAAYPVWLSSMAFLVLAGWHGVLSERVHRLRPQQDGV